MKSRQNLITAVGGKIMSGYRIYKIYTYIILSVHGWRTYVDYSLHSQL